MDNIPLLDDEHLHVEDETNFLQIVLLGKTGSGKSSLANTIFGGQAKFKVDHSAGSGTKDCHPESKTVSGRELRLIDTPGLFDTELNNTEINPEHLMFLLDCAPGIHAFLILLKVEKFTKQDQEVTETIFKQFGKDALKYSTVIFTHGDQLPEGMTIEEWVKGNDGVKDLLQKCGGRCHVFDNKYWKHSEDPYRNNQVHVENLLNTIEKTVRKNGGRCYTNEALLRFEREIQQAQMNESSPEDDAQSKRNKAKMSVHNKIWPKIKHVTVGCVIGVLVGGVALGALSVCLIPCVITGAVVTGTAAVASGTVGGLAGKVFKLKKEKKKL